jgi:hypothetical protein
MRESREFGRFREWKSRVPRELYLRVKKVSKEMKIPRRPWMSLLMRLNKIRFSEEI